MAVTEKKLAERDISVLPEFLTYLQCKFFIVSAMFPPWDSYALDPLDTPNFQTIFA